MDRNDHKRDLLMFELYTCDECQKPFFRDEEWKTTCLVCFKCTSGYSLYGADKQIILFQDALHDLTDKIKKYAYDADLWKRRAISAKEKKAPFTQQQIKDLIRLCHPDKHGGTKKATEMTQWLLSLKEED